MESEPTRDEQSDRVAESVRRALALVGPAESGYERISPKDRHEAA